MSNPIRRSVPGIQEETPPPITISTSFAPDSHKLQHDLVFLTNDSVLFYLHSNVFRQVSTEAFQSIIAQPGVPIEGYGESIVHIEESSEVLDILLHALYRIPYIDQSPRFQAFVDAMNAMRKYGIEPSVHLIPSNPFYVTLLGFAPLVPLELYALAAQFDVYHLAAAASSHLLSRPLTTISDTMAERIGAVYLNRLLTLHLQRMESLKGILLTPPIPHQATETCDVDQQRKLTSAWAMTAANFAWNARPDLSTSLIKSSFSALGDSITCELCRQALENRVQDAIARWATVQYTI